MEIRKAVASDANILDNMLNLLIKDEIKYNDTINPNFVVKNFYINYIVAPNRCILKAIVDDKIVGYIYGYFNDDLTTIKRIAKLDALYVLEEYRNQGIAIEMIKEFKNWCLGKEVDEIAVNVLCENKKAKQLYSKFGFKTKSEEMNLKIKE